MIPSTGPNDAEYGQKIKFELLKLFKKLKLFSINAEIINKKRSTFLKNFELKVRTFEWDQ